MYTRTRVHTYTRTHMVCSQSEAVAVGPQVGVLVHNADGLVAVFVGPGGGGGVNNKNNSFTTQYKYEDYYSGINPVELRGHYIKNRI